MAATPKPFTTTFGFYAEAYRQAANSLAGEVLSGRMPVEILAAPIGFCYRHALELALKDAHTWVQGWVNVAASRDRAPWGMAASPGELEKSLRGHDLHVLLAGLEERLDAARFTRFDDGVHLTIRTIGILDADAQRFRYPFQTKGRGASFTDNQFRDLDVERLKSSVDAAITFLLQDLRYRNELDVDDDNIEAAWENEVRMLDAFGDGDGEANVDIGWRHPDFVNDPEDGSPEMLSDGDDA